MHPVWPLITGLAIGFAVGREAYRFGGGSEAKGPAADTSAAPAIAADKSAYAKMSEFPAGWLKDADIGKSSELLNGLTDQQKTTVMQAMNTRNCECGCGMGTLAVCLQKDPNCPRSPAMAKLAVDLVKQGKGLTEIQAAIDAKQKEGAKPAAAPAAPEVPAGPKKIELFAWNPRKGPKAAKVTIVEFSDFQCPFCSRVVPTIHQIEEQYGKDVAIIFKNQPLPFHDKAKGAAYAFLAAGRQGKAWEMHDKMFANNTALTPPDLEKYAKDLGLDVAKFTKDVEDPKVKEEVDADSKQGTSVGASGTPAFFINGRNLVGAQPFEKFKEVIDDEIKKADELIKSGVPLADVYKKRTE
jgi:protein-disulfide isomerase